MLLLFVPSETQGLTLFSQPKFSLGWTLASEKKEGEAEREEQSGERLKSENASKESKPKHKFKLFDTPVIESKSKEESLEDNQIKDQPSSQGNIRDQEEKKEEQPQPELS